MQSVTELTAEQLHIFVGIFITLVCIFIQQTLTVPIICSFVAFVCSSYSIAKNVRPLKLKLKLNLIYIAP